MKNYIYKLTVVVGCTFLSVVAGCKKDLLDTQPLSSISDATFWKTAGDATLALNGVYDSGAGFTGYNFWAATSMVNLDLMAGNGSEKESIPDNFTNGTLNSTYSFVGSYYSQAYSQIGRCNNFLANIGLVSMDAAQKAVMIGEVKTIRAYNYFNLALYFGDVPLVQKLLTVDEANSVSRTPKAEVWAFCESELKAAAAALPVSVSADRLGHMTAASALAILGRLQLAQKKWAEAATTYKTIIDYNYYAIDPRYRELFLNAGETSREIIMSMQYIRDTYNHALLQYLTPETWGGWHQYSPFNELVEAYECKDGKTIAESPLFDKNNPYNNRDPRMDFNIMISDRTSFRGKVYSAKPGTTLPDRLNQYPGVWSGYAIYKFLEDDPAVATTNNTGNNFPLIRYAEVLLGYLEAKLESGSGVDQVLLDATINKVRGRAAVAMPAITTLDPTALRTILRRERRVEFAFEGIRYFDCLRWGIIGSENNQQFTGMKLTNDPANYKDYPVNANGYYIFKKRSFVVGKNELWPIPQSERDLNKNLTQNPGY
ncbi:SusD-like protein BACOVA_02651 [Pedobacter sp. Bi27]|uniref:RagB/SusD family nutrient uptake outer membrane protein n=1 Tax=unclassified Pedobacter TaxID=2628915 RepID=UPI001D963625|nr:MULTISPECIES: RagB/SusD family nutrient uptake outer membrane protein [unclassified Pedobacter]CAH0312553.1 SusD-like protein BACOVA_02651 [Pedobacter sp. Bi36]CAH0318181.1 SusD-like protein BACOVA_02651 [Pedobacter sp. Bi27]CAH0319372.1 SusD-like protein BACOVA_02651 [Pedobacter sp. Bi126]